MRLLQDRLRKHGIRWVREPNWNQPSHDLAVGDFRLAVEKAVSALPNLSLDKWLVESGFRVHTDSIRYTFNDKHGNEKLAFEKYAGGQYTDGQIAGLLNDRGYRTSNKTGRRRFTKDSLLMAI